MIKKKSRLVYLALAVMALAMLASLPLDFACKMAEWSYPDFEVRSSVVRLGGLVLYPSLWGLRRDFVHAAWASLALAVGTVACRGREEREDAVAVALLCLACLAALLLRHVPFAIDQAEMLEDLRRLVVAGYAPLCHASARTLVRHLGRRLGSATSLAAHAMLVMCCAWDGAGYSLAVSVPTVAWMALCWTLFALPVLWEGDGREGRPARRPLRAALAFAAQVAVLSLWRLLEIVRSLGSPMVPGPGWSDHNWLAVHMAALVALPTSSYRELVTDPSMLDGLQRLPLAWLGVAYGSGVRLAYAVLLLLFLAASWVVWRDARGGGRGRMVEVLALGVLLSNLWGTACSVLLLGSTGVVTLLSGNPFQLVPVACLLAAELAPSGDGEAPVPGECLESTAGCGPSGVRLLGAPGEVLTGEDRAIAPIPPDVVPMGERVLPCREAQGGEAEGGGSGSEELRLLFRFAVACALALGVTVHGASRVSGGPCEGCYGSGLCQACGGYGDGCGRCYESGLCASCRGTGKAGRASERPTASPSDERAGLACVDGEVVS